MQNPIKAFRKEEKSLSRKKFIKYINRHLFLDTFIDEKTLMRVENGVKLKSVTVLQIIKSISIAFPDEINQKELVNNYARWHRQKFGKEFKL